MTIVTALVLGFCAGFLIYIEAAILAVSSNAEPSVAFVALVFFGGWIVCAILLARGARGPLQVVKRGSLLGAALWLLMIGAGILYGGRAASITGAVSGAEMAGAVIGGGLVALITGGLSVVMAVLCLITYAVAHLIGREREDSNSRPCPECAEPIRLEARRCRYCGTDVSLAAAGGTLPA